jgi:hypothetical protein
MATVDSVSEALAGSREMLRADDADLELLGVEDGVVKVRLLIGPDACADCILERSMLEAALLHGLREADPSIGGVVVDDPRSSVRQAG